MREVMFSDECFADNVGAGKGGGGMVHDVIEAEFFVS